MGRKTGGADSPTKKANIQAWRIKKTQAAVRKGSQPYVKHHAGMDTPF